MARPIDIQTAGGWGAMIAELPEDLEDIAKATKVLETQYGAAKITSGVDLLRMILLHAGLDFPLRQTVAVSAETGGPSVSHVTLHKKMRLAPTFLRALVERLVADPETKPERWSGFDVLLVDGSCFCGPGAETTDARMHLQLRLSNFEMVDAFMEDRSTGESFKRFTWREGQLAVGDRGYCNPPGIAWVVEQGADVLVRVNRASLPLRRVGGERIELMRWLRSLKGHQAHEQRVCTYSHEHDCEVEGRLVAMRLPADQAKHARIRVRKELGKRVTSADLEAAQYVVLFTTVKASRMSAKMCLDLYRLRWQVELAFKRFKSLCHFDRLPNYRPDTVLSWLYAKLLLALLMHRIASGRSTLFPPAERKTVLGLLDVDALESDEHPLAGDRRCPAAA
jgi:hypothetical protein